MSHCAEPLTSGPEVSMPFRASVNSSLVRTSTRSFFGERAASRDALTESSKLVEPMEVMPRRM